MSFFDEAFGILFAPVNLLLRGVAELLPKPEVPSGLADRSQTYNANARTNDAKLGDVRQRLYGRAPVWVQNASEPYRTYDGLHEILHVLAHVTVGPATISAVRVGGTSLSALAGSTAEVLLPNQRATLVHPNTYTNPDARDQEIPGGALSEVTFQVPVTFSGDRITLDGSDPVLYAIPIGSTLTVSGSASNDGSYSVLDVGIEGRPGAWRQSWVRLASSLTTETVTATLGYSQSDTGAKTVRSESLAFVFDAALSQVTAPAGEEYDDALADFRVGDLIGADGASANAGRSWRVVDTLGGRGLVLAGDPVSNETVSCKILLRRRRVGSYLACPPGAQVDRVGVHLFWQGLYHAVGDTLGNRSVMFEVRWRPVDGAGTPTGDWASQVVVVVGNTNSAWRETRWVAIDPPCRAEVDIARVTLATDNSQIQDAATLGGVIGAIVNNPGDDPAVDSETTRIALEIRSSGQLSRLSDNQVNVDAQALLPVWQGAELGWSAPQATRSIAWAAADWLLSTSRGRVTAAQLDLDSFLAAETAWSAAGDTFDGVFDQGAGYLEGANTILRCGRATVRRDALTGRYQVYRDAETAPVVTLANAINCRLSGERLETPSSDSVSGLRVTWFDPLRRETRDGPVVGLDTDPERIQMLGLTSWLKAYQQAFYRYRLGRLRVRRTSAETEMLGLLLNQGDRALVGSVPHGWGQVAAVKSISGLQVQVWPALRWVTGAQHYVHLTGRDGRPGARINCTRGAGDDRLVLATAVDVTPRAATDAAPMPLLFGHDGTETVPASGPVVAIVTDTSPGAVTTADGLQVPALAATVGLVLDDARVYEDPGEAPPDSTGGSGDAAVLAITGLVATASAPGEGDFAVSWDAVVAPYTEPIYELAWRYAGALAWTVVRRGSSTVGAVVVPEAGEAEIRVRGLAAERVIQEQVVAVTVTAGGGGLTAVSSPAYVSGSGPAVPVRSAVSYLEIRGGVPPYTVTTEYVSGAVSTVQDAGANGIRFSASPPPGVTRTGVYRRRVEDAVATVVYSNDITYELERTGSSGGGVIP